jgi:Domain of unknown function (DUF4219)
MAMGPLSFLSMEVMHYADNIFFFQEKMSSTQSVETHIPKLDGSNFLVWAGKMQAFLRLQGLWNMVRGLEPNLPELSEGSMLSNNKSTT